MSFAGNFLVTSALLLVACGSRSEIEGVRSMNTVPTQSKMQMGFSWVIDAFLCAMPKPGLTVLLEKDLAFLESRGIDVLVTLTEDALDTALLAQYHIASVHLPVRDFAAPTQEQLRKFVKLADHRRKKGEKVGVHCYAGKGRTGTFLAAYLISEGMTADAAIEKIRELRPGSIETDEQEEAVRRFQTLR